MTYLLLILFVWGISKVINGVAEFFEWDIDEFYTFEFDGDLKYYRPKWHQFFLKPTIYCNVCMSSFWGSVCYWLLLQGRSIPEWILHCVICAGIIWLMNLIIETIEKF